MILRETDQNCRILHPQRETSFSNSRSNGKLGLRRTVLPENREKPEVNDSKKRLGILKQECRIRFRAQLSEIDWRTDESIWGDRMPAKNAAKNPQAQKFTDFRSMLDKVGNEIDVVLVWTPIIRIFPLPWLLWNWENPFSSKNPWLTTFGRSGLCGKLCTITVWIP